MGSWHRRNRLLLLLIVLYGLGLAAGAGADAPKDKNAPKYTNRLAKETSPYLLMHAITPPTGMRGVRKPSPRPSRRASSSFSRLAIARVTGAM